MQLLLYKPGKRIGSQDLWIDMSCSPDLSQTLTASAITLEWLRHIPFRGRIEEGHFITLFNGFKRYHFHCVCVKKHIGVTTMVNVLQVFWLQHNMSGGINLHSEIRWLCQDAAGRKICNDLPWSIRSLSEESLLIVIDILPDNGEDVIAN
jgi:hypothetical protein